MEEENKKEKYKKIIIIVILLLFIVGVIGFLLRGKDNTYTISFISEGIEKTIKVEKGRIIDQLIPEEKEGYIFLGWYEGDELFDFSKPVTENTKLEAKWEEIKTIAEGEQCVVNYDTAGGELKESKTIKCGEKIEEGEEPTKEGYTFVEWQLNGKVYDFNKTVDKDITLTAVWKEEIKKTYTITFESNGGSKVDKQTVEEGEKGEAPVSPTKEGSVFIEWQLNGKVYNFSEEITKDITLKAKWESIGLSTYVITFDTTGGTPVSTQIKKKGSTVTKPSNPTKEGYTFVEWQLNNKTYEFNKPVEENITLKAVWKEAEKHTVRFESNGGTSVSSQKVADKDKAVIPTAPTRSGYTFIEWRLNGKTYDFNTLVTSDITLEAEWKEIQKNVYKVTFEVDGKVIGNQAVEEGKTVTKPQSPNKEGYTFKQWELNGSEYKFTTPVTKDITLKAAFSPIPKYTVKFVSNGTTLSTQTVLEGEKAVIPTAPTRSGYVFIEWQLNTNTYNFNSPVTKDITLEAKWQKIENDKYTVRFEVDGKVISNQVVEKGSTATKPNSDPSKEGYIFTGWQLNGSYYKFSTSVTSNITLKAAFSPIPKYTVKFVSNGTTLSTQTVLEGEKAVIPPAPTRSGYTFIEWRLNGKTYNFSSPVTKDITLEAEWQEIPKPTYTVKFSVDGNIIGSQVVEEGKTATRPSDPSKEGYTFNEWQLNNNKYTFTTAVTSNITLTAKFTAIPKHTVKFVSNGTTLSTQTVVEGETVSAPTTPTREGYVFIEWQLNNNKYDFNSPVTKDITLEANWQEIPKPKRTVTFVTNGGTSVSTQVVEDGSTATKPSPNPSKDGYTFVEWQQNNKKYEFSSPVTSDITLTANWTPINYTVRYYQGSTKIGESTHQYGISKTLTKYTSLSTNALTGWEFAYWTNSQSGTTKKYTDAQSVESLTKESNGVINIYAVYKRTIIFNTGIESTKTTKEEIQYYNPYGAGTKTAVSELQPVEIEGWTAIGYRADTTAGNKTYDIVTTINPDVTSSTTKVNFYSVYKRDLTISYNGNGGSGSTGPTTKTVYLNTNQTTTSSQPVVLLNNLFTKTGYRFKEWAEGSENGVRYKEGDNYDPKLAYNAKTFGKTIYAVWEEIPKYEVIFDSLGGSAVASQLIQEGNRVQKPENPSKTGYTFKGWLLNNQTYDFNSAVTKKITLTAKWEPIVYNFHLKGPGEKDVVLYATYGEDMPKLTSDNIPTKENEKFIGWATSVNAGNVFYYNGKGESVRKFERTSNGLALYPQWAKKYTVTFNTGENASTIQSQTVFEGDLAVQPDHPTREGYKFTGWQLNGQGYSFGVGTEVTSDITLTATWEPITYKIVYNQGNNVTNTPGSTKIGESQHTYDQAKNLTKYSSLGATAPAGWEFAGWSTSTNVPANITSDLYKDGQSVEKLTSSANGTVNLYAVFKRTIMFKVSPNSSATTSETQYYNPYNTPNRTAVKAATPATISGWNAIKYQLDASAEIAENNVYDINETINPFVKAGITSTTVDIYVLYERTLTINYNGNGATSGSTNPTTKTIYLNSSSTNTSDQTVTLNDNGFTKTGSTFNYWSDGTTTELKPKTSYNPNIAYNATTFGKTLNAIWKDPILVSVSFNLNCASGNGSGGQIDPVTATYGQTMPDISTEVPTCSGYAFGGWYYGTTQYYTATGESVKTWNRSVDTELKGKWIKVSLDGTLTSDYIEVNLTKTSTLSVNSSSTIKYSSSDTNIFTINENSGLITPNKSGMANVLILVDNNTYIKELHVITSVLFVGNSKTIRNNLPERFKEFSSAAGKYVTIQRVTQGGTTLECLYNASDTNNETTCSNTNQIYNTLFNYVDYVVLQEDNDATSERTVSAAKNIVNYLKNNNKNSEKDNSNPNVRVVYYAAWLSQETLNPDSITSVKNQNDSNSRYVAAQKATDKITKTKSKIVWAGNMILQYRKTLPFTWNNWFSDERHPSYYGTYLVTCGLYNAIFNETTHNIDEDGNDKYILYYSPRVDQQISYDENGDYYYTKIYNKTLSSATKIYLPHNIKMNNDNTLTVISESLAKRIQKFADENWSKTLDELGIAYN